MGSYKSSVRTQRARMNRLQHAVPFSVDISHALCRGRAPGQKNDAPGTHARDNLQRLLGQALPAFIRMAGGLVGANRQASVEHQDAALGPGGQEATFVGRALEGRVVVLDAGEDVDEGRGRGRGRADGEGQTMGLVVVMVRVLTDNDNLDRVEGGMSRPASESVDVGGKGEEGGMMVHTRSRYRSREGRPSRRPAFLSAGSASGLGTPASRSPP